MEWVFKPWHFKIPKLPEKPANSTWQTSNPNTTKLKRKTNTKKNRINFYFYLYKSCGIPQATREGCFHPEKPPNLAG